MALYRLKRIAYPGEDYVRALTAIQAGQDSPLAQSAEAVLGKLQRARSFEKKQ
jgi:hypothetical protein